MVFSIPSWKVYRGQFGVGLSFWVLEMFVLGKKADRLAEGGFADEVPHVYCLF
jgi:hypothetical protein